MDAKRRFAARKIVRLLPMAALLLLAFVAFAPHWSATAALLEVDDSYPGNSPPQFTTIQAAINYATAGDQILIHTGTYAENVVVNKTLSVFGETQNGSIIDPPSGNAIVVSSANVNISSLTVRGSQYGILASGLSPVNLNVQYVTFDANQRGMYVTSAAGAQVSQSWFSNHSGTGNAGLYVSLASGFAARNNTFVSNYYAVYLDRTGGAIVRDGVISSGRIGIYVDRAVASIVDNNEIFNLDTSGYALYVDRATGSVVSSNRVHDNGRFGIYLSNAANASLYLNNMSNNAISFQLLPMGTTSPAPYGHSIAASNMIDGKPTYYYVNTTNIVVPSGAGWVGAFNVTNITVPFMSTSRVFAGIWLANVNNARLDGLNFTAPSNTTYYGLSTYNSNNISASGINFTGRGYGAYIQLGSNITLRDSRISGNTSDPIYFTYGAIAFQVSGFVALNNIVFHASGFQSQSSTAPLFQGNVINDTDISFYLSSSAYARLNSNTLVNAGGLAVWGGAMSHFQATIAPNNTWDGRPFRSFINVSSPVVPSNLAWVLFANVTNASVSAYSVPGRGYQAAVVAFSSNITFADARFNNSSYGIYIPYSSGVNVWNSASNNSSYIVLAEFSSNINFSNGTWTNLTSTAVSSYAVDWLSVQNVTFSSLGIDYFAELSQGSNLLIRNVTGSHVWQVLSASELTGLTVDRATVNASGDQIDWGDTAFYMYNVSVFNLTNSSFTSFETGVVIDSDSWHWNLSNVSFFNTYDTGFYSSSGNVGNISLTNVRIEGQEGVSSAAGIFMELVYAPVTLTGLNITRYSTGVFLQYMDHVTVAGGQFNTSYYGVEFYEVDDSTVTGNTFTDIWAGSVTVSFASNVTVSSNNFSNPGSWAIRASDCVLMRITGNTIHYAYAGIRLEGGGSSLVSNNLINSSWDYGIYTNWDHENTTFLSNTITNGNQGFMIDQSQYLRLFSNSVSGNVYNYHLQAYSIYEYYHQVPTNNTADGEPVYYLVNATGGLVPASAGWVVMANVTSYTVSGVSIAHEWEAVKLYQVRTVTITGATLNSSYYGVYGDQLTGVSIQDSTVESNSYGIYISTFVNSSVQRVRFNTNSQNDFAGFYGWNFTLNANVFNASGYSGVGVYQVDRSNITNNRFENVTQVGMELSGSSNDVLYNNTFYGVFASFSIYGWDLAHFTHTLPINNTIEGRPIYLYTNASGVTVPASAGMVIFANVTNGRVDGGYYDHVNAGVYAFQSRFINISNATFARGYQGVNLRETRDVWMTNITTDSNNCCPYTLVNIDYQSYNISLNNSRIERAYTVINAYNAWNIRINNITAGNQSSWSTSTVFQANGLVYNVTIENSDFNQTSYTLQFYGYNDVDMISNVTVANSSFGQFTYRSVLINSQYVANITFYHNNFWMVDWYPYGLPVDDYGVTTWNLSYPTGGNFWANWTTPDDYQGASQSTAGSDGFVDSPFQATQYVADAYPLGAPWPPRTVLVSPANNTAISPGTILDFAVPLYFDGANYSINGGSPVAFTAPFDINTTGWSIGNYTVWVNCTDASGIFDRQAFMFEIETTPPTIAALSPAPNGTYPSGTQLNFTILDPHLAMNATWDQGYGENFFNTPWNISTDFWGDGTFTITIRAWDTAGNHANASFNYTIDTYDPYVWFNSPGDGTVFASGTTIDLYVYDLTLQNASWNNGSGWNLFSAPYDIDTTGWADGSYTVQVIAYDLFGRVGFASADYTLDSTQPSISVTSPPNNSVRVAGTVLDFDVTDPHLYQAMYQVNFGGYAAFSAPFQISTTGWADGNYSVQVYADDTAYNWIVVNFAFVIDSTPATVVLNTPANNSVIRAGTILDFSVVEPNLNNAQWVQGGFSQMGWVAPFDINTTGWADGAVSVNITVTDLAGNVRTRQFNFTMDSTLPAIALLAPGNGSYVRGGRPLDFAVTDLHLTLVTYNNGSGNVVLAAPFDIVTGGWPDGPTTVTINATDSAGNVRSSFFVFTFDSTLPTVLLVTPANNSAVRSGTVLDFTVTDTNLDFTLWSNGDSGNQSLAFPHNVSTTGWAQGTYTVFVNATDLANNTRVLLVTIHIDNTPPVIVLNQPTNGSTFGAGTLIDFSITDAFGFSATWNNGSGSNALGAPFDIDTTGWVDASVTVWVNATDSAGNNISASFVFTIDNSFPAVILVTPANNSVIFPGTTLDFDVVDNDLNNVTVNYGAGTAPFSAPYNLATTGWADGSVNVTIVAIDNSSHTVVVVYHFTIDSVAPSITLDAPSNGSVLRAGTLVNFTIGDLNLDFVQYTDSLGIHVLGAPHDLDTSSWPDGTQNLSVMAVDRAGNSLNRSYTFVVDSTPPTVMLVSPANGSVVAPGVVFAYTVSDAHAVTATWNNGSGSNAFTVLYNVSTAGWADQAFTLTVNATDIVGNTVSFWVNFEVDSTPPSVSLVTPSNGSVITSGTPIDLQVLDLHLTGATWNNGSGPVAFTAPFDINTTGWAQGPTTITVIATDAALNVQMRSYIMTFDDFAPSVALVSPANNSAIRPGTLVNFSVTDANLGTVTWDNGTGPQPLSSPFSVSTAGWAEGPVSITVRALDLASNVRQITVGFTIDATQPTIVLASPANHSVFVAGAVINLTISDANGVASATYNNGSGPAPLLSPYDISTAGWPDGTFVLTVAATDSAGNFVVNTFSFTVDSTAPSISIISPANNSVIAPNVTLAFSVTDTFGLTNASWSNGSGSAALAPPFEVSTAGWADAAVTVTVWAYDVAGNGRSASFTFTVDGTLPAVTLDSPSNGSVVLPGTTVALTVTDAHLTTVTYDNGTGPQALSPPHDISTTGWADAAYNITIIARDAAGNNRTVVYRITLDSLGPVISLNSPANNSIITGGVVLDINISDANIGTATWSNGSGNNALPSPFDVSTAGWPDGLVTVVINVTDLAGNARSASFRFTMDVGSSRVDLQACKLEYSIVSPK